MKANIIRILTIFVVLTLILVLQASSGWSNDDSTPYQMTPDAGAYDKGAIIKINLDDSSFTILYSFAGGTSDGANPSYESNLTLSDSILYGMTQNGGSNDKGVIFKINMDGSGFTILHSFAGGSSDGANPSYGSLTLSGSTFYGMTQNGGSNDKGVIFKINTDGSGFTILHSFAGGSSDGANPSYGSLALSDSTLYGMTQNGGSDDKGVIFKISTDGSDFSILRSFAGGTNDGANPYGSLALSDSTLYGMTQNGGSNDKGVIFKINTDSSYFSILRSFAGGTSDGANPYGELTILSNPTVSSDSTLYGMTNSGDTYGYGGCFSMNSDGTDYTSQPTPQPEEGCSWKDIIKNIVRTWTENCKYFRENIRFHFKYCPQIDIEVDYNRTEKNICNVVSLTLFTTQIQDSNIFLEWETASELDNAGFNLWRSESEDGMYIKINPQIIEAEGRPTLSAAYCFTDYTACPGVIYYYTLEDINTKNVSTFHGPISATIPAPQSSYIPYWLKWYQPWQPIYDMNYSFSWLYYSCPGEFCPLEQFLHDLNQQVLIRE